MVFYESQLDDRGSNPLFLFYVLGYRRTQIVVGTLYLYILGYGRTQIGVGTLYLFLYFRVWEHPEVDHMRPLWGWQYASSLRLTNCVLFEVDNRRPLWGWQYIYWVYWTNVYWSWSIIIYMELIYGMELCDCMSFSLRLTICILLEINNMYSLWNQQYAFSLRLTNMYSPWN